MMEIKNTFTVFTKIIRIIFFEEIINNKNIFNLSESKKEEMLTVVKTNLDLMKENPLKSLLKEIIS